MPSRALSNSPPRRRERDERARHDDRDEDAERPRRRERSRSRERPSDRDRDGDRDRVGVKERDRDRDRDTHRAEISRHHHRRWVPPHFLQDISHMKNQVLDSAHVDSRSRTRSRSPHRRTHRHRTPPPDSGSESETESESSDQLRQRRRKERSREEKEERRRRKEKKREKRAKRDKKKGTAAVTAQWGKHGIISETDVAKKDSEFRTWLVEERKINPETMTKERTKKEFAVYVEDYNTATLPHEKYYDMAKYEFRMNLIRSGQTVPLEGLAYDPMADIKAHSSFLKSQEKEKKTFLSREEIEELRRIERERMEIGKRRILGLDVPRSMGVRTEEVSSMSFD